MSNAIVDEKFLIGKDIEALGLSERERSRALAALAKADALVGAFFAIAELLTPSQGRSLSRASLRLQK